MQGKVASRWRIAAAGVAMQVALGAVYAWSVFRKPLSEHFDTSVASVNLIFSLAILALGFAAVRGQPAFGERTGEKVDVRVGMWKDGRWSYLECGR